MGYPMGYLMGYLTGYLTGFLTGFLASFLTGFLTGFLKISSRISSPLAPGAYRWPLLATAIFKPCGRILGGSRATLNGLKTNAAPNNLLTGVTAICVVVLRVLPHFLKGLPQLPANNTL